MKSPIPFGKYYLMERIAVGGMAEVFKAKTFGAEGFAKTAALKRILPNIAEDHEFITMFIDEAKIAVQLNHANVAQIFELGEEQGSYYIAMEYIHGKDLRTIFERSRRPGGSPVAPAQAAYIMARACEGLDYAHRKKDSNGSPLNIVHRDISPQNILVSYEGEVKIIDFGVAKAQNKMGQTQAGILKGKFGYMSPEQVQGLPLNQRSDIFSLGIILHEILTGKRLFVGESDFHTLQKISQAEAYPPSQDNPEVPPALDRIVLKALARSVEERYQYASELQQDLQRFLYTLEPIYDRQNLTKYMKHVFNADIAKDKKRTSQYEAFFAAQGTGSPATAEVQTPTNNWSAPPPVAPDSYSGMPPGPQSQSSFPPASSHPAATPALTAPPSHQPPSNFYAPQADEDSTMLEQGGLASAMNPPPPSFSPVLPSSSPSPLDDFADEGESDTVIDLNAIEDDKTSSSKARIAIIFLTTLICLAAIAIGVFFLLQNYILVEPPPPEDDPGKLILRFYASTKGVQFKLNNKPLSKEQIERNSPRRLTIKIKEEGQYTLSISKPGFRPVSRRFRISPGSELSTGIKFVPLAGFAIISSEPKGAVVLIDGKRARRITPATYKIRAGTHVIQILMQGRKPHTQTVTLKARQKIKLSAKLPRTRAQITVMCRGTGQASVYLNGRKYTTINAKKPWTKKYLRIKRTYKLKVVPKGYKPFEKEVSFPLNPYKIFRVNCAAPSTTKAGNVRIVSTPRAKIVINNRSYGLTPKVLRLQVGTHQIILVNSKTRKRLSVAYQVKSQNNNPLVILPSNWK